MQDSSPIAVTIARQLGSGGAHLGQRVAQRLGYLFVDHQILHKACEILGVEAGDYASRDERRSRFWERMVDSLAMGGPEQVYGLPPIQPVSDVALFRAETHAMRELTGGGSVVIIGHGGFRVLKEHPRALHVFVHASVEFRIPRIVQRYKVAEAEARRILTEGDQGRAKFICTMTGANWTDATNYHLCLDTSVLGFDLAEEMIVTALGRIEEGQGRPAASGS